MLCFELPASIVTLPCSFLFDSPDQPIAPFSHIISRNKTMATTYTAKPPQVAVPTKVKMAVPAFSDVAKPANDVSCPPCLFAP
jgi:hypothetical protein